jgi:hypothetical protein
MPTSPWSVCHVETLPGFRLAVRFTNGTAGMVEMKELINGPTAGVFAALRDLSVFAQAYIDYGAVTWPGDLDLAPDAMYDDIKTSGLCRLPASEAQAPGT